MTSSSTDKRGIRQQALRTERLWLRVSLVGEIVDEALTVLGQNDRDFVLDRIHAYANNEYYFYLPVSGEVPTIVFKNEYESIIGELDFSTRFAASLIGQAMEGAGGTIKDFAGKLGGKIGGVIEALGQFGSQLSGNINAPKIWKGATIDDIAFSGTMGFETFYEYECMKAYQILFSAMSTPGKTGATKITEKVLNALGFETGSYLYEGLSITTIAPPQTKIAAIHLFSGRMGLREEPGPIFMETESMPLLCLDDLYMTDASVTFGVDGSNGIGIDNAGIPHIGSVSLNLTPQSFESVSKGLARLYQADVMARMKTLETTYKVSVSSGWKNPFPEYAKNFADATKWDIANSAIFTAFNAQLLGAIPGYAAVQARGIQNLAVFPLRRHGEMDEVSRHNRARFFL